MMGKQSAPDTINRMIEETEMRDATKYLLGMSGLPLVWVGASAVISELTGKSAPSFGLWMFAITASSVCVMGAWLTEIMERKSTVNRIVVDLKPNQVVIGGIPFHCPFSTTTHFFKSRDALAEAVSLAVNESMLKDEKLITLKKSALVRVWPGNLQVTDFEMEALAEAIDAVFLSPEIELKPPSIASA